MSKYQNGNVVFRCPAPLKAKMIAFAEANDQDLSTFIRSACVEVLRREMPTVYPKVPSAADVDARLAELMKGSRGTLLAE